MRIIVTGSEGYIGKYLVKRLKKEGNKVFGVDKVKGSDITTLDTLFYCNVFKPDLVYHLAAQTSVIESLKRPDHTIFNNVIGTMNMLRLKCKIIFASSGSVYGDRLDAKETDLPYPQSPYAASKLSGEFYIKNAEIPYVIFRIGNVYGRNNNKGVIKALLKKNGKIFGDGTHVRDYIHIDDVIEAFVQAKDWKDGVYNIGTGKGATVNEVADLLKVKKIYVPEVKEQKYISLNISKTIELTNWKPKYKLGEYINK